MKGRKNTEDVKKMRYFDRRKISVVSRSNKPKLIITDNLDEPTAVVNADFTFKNQDFKDGIARGSILI